MTHQELDELFRANSERGEFSPEPGEWEQMTALLDEDERRERIARWVSMLWIAVFALLIIGGMAGLWYYQQQPQPQPVVAGSSSIQSQAPDQQTDNAAVTLAGEDSDINQNNSASQAQIGESLLTENTEQLPTDTDPAFAKTRPASTASGSTSANQDLPTVSRRSVAVKTTAEEAAENHVTSSGNLNGNRESSQVSGSDASFSQSAAANDAKAVSDPSTQSNPAIAAEEESDRSTDDLTALPTLALQQVDFQTQLSPNIPADFWQGQSRWGFGAFIAEEITSVRMSNRVRLGTRIGLQARYYANTRWSFDLGVAYARKHYRGSEADMQAMQYLFVDEVMPFQTDGACDLIEVPLSASFLFADRNHSGLFLNAGLLSRYVFREHMHFHYNQQAPNQPSEVVATDGLGTLVGTTHFQFGYRFVTQNGPAWRLGPYVQVPVAMLGHAKLPLYSVGLQAEFELF